jgi:isocitrate/isopropylmalate dehydrogenase
MFRSAKFRSVARQPRWLLKMTVNPINMLLTVKLMFDWLNETERATRLESVTSH